jgi:hypothetical protein
MKRITALLLLCLFLFSACGNPLKEPVTFFYLNNNYKEDMSPAIGSEQREASGHRDDLMYLMALYLMGPADEDLHSPLPQGTAVLSVQLQHEVLTVILSDIPEPMSDARFTMACSCLALTALELAQAEYVTIQAESKLLDGEKMITIDHSILGLVDRTLQNRDQ